MHAPHRPYHRTGNREQHVKFDCASAQATACMPFYQKTRSV
jgi:hypothetical protein